MKLTSLFRVLVAVQLPLSIHGCSSAPTQQVLSPVVEQGQPSVAYQAPGYQPAPGAATVVTANTQAPAVVALLNADPRVMACFPAPLTRAQSDVVHRHISCSGRHFWKRRQTAAGDEG